MKIIKNGLTVIHPDGNVTFTDFTINVEDDPSVKDADGDADFKKIARLVLDDAYQRALAALGHNVILDVTKIDQVH